MVLTVHKKIFPGGPHCSSAFRCSRGVRKTIQHRDFHCASHCSLTHRARITHNAESHDLKSQKPRTAFRRGCFTDLVDFSFNTPSSHIRAAAFEIHASNCNLLSRKSSNFHCTQYTALGKFHCNLASEKLVRIFLGR